MCKRLLLAALASGLVPLVSGLFAGRRAPVGNRIGEAIFSRVWPASLTSRLWSPDGCREVR
jgi:hypothetical protein